MAATVPRRVCQGLELVHVQQAVCVCPTAASTPLAGPGSLSSPCGPPCHTPPSTLCGSFMHSFLSLSFRDSLVCVLPRAASPYNSRGRPPAEVLCGPLPDSLHAGLSLGASLTCALFLTGPLAVFFSVSYFLLWVCTCTCACLYVCVAPHPSCVCTRGVRPSVGRAQAPP